MTTQATRCHQIQNRHGTAILAAGVMVALITLVLPSHASAAGLLVSQGGFGGVLEMKEHDVRVTVNNSIAVTQVDQVFVNTENRQVEALYTFPVPREASVSNFSMWIAGKEMIGEVVEKERARQIYESYKQKKRDPGLLEQVDFKQFEMRIFPIPAGAEQRIRIEYYQQLNVDHDWATYVYPLATDVRGGQLDSQVKGRFSMTVDFKSEVPIKELHSESHPDDFVVVSHEPKYAQAAMELNEADLSRDIVMAVQTKRPRTGLDVITSHPAGEDGYFMLTLTPGEDLSSTAEPMDYVFLLDVSGSMSRDEKLAISRQSVVAFIDSLGPDDRFECLAFNLVPTPLFRSLQLAAAENLDQAKEFFDAQRARGGTVLQPALSAAYAYRDDDRPLNVVLLSDGMTEVGEQAELLGLIQSRPAGVRVFCIGVGNEVNRPLLDQMAKQAGGLAAFVSTEDSFGRQAHLMRQKLVRPAIENVAAQFAGAAVRDVEPTELGDLFYGTPLRLLGRYGANGPVAITLTGTVQGGPWKQTVEVDLPKADEGNSEIERIWAQQRVQRLLAGERAGKGSQRDEIVRLSEAYSIVSPYASMLVLENNAEYKRWKIEQRNATRIERDRQSRNTVQEKLAEMRRRASEGFEVERAEKLVSTPDRVQAPATTRPQPNQSASQSPSQSVRPSRSVDLDVESSSRGRNRGGRGGGAIDPVTALLALVTAGGAAMAGRRKNRNRT
ncbi:Vault protein inter-alpha-trypsin [Planctomycetes bacterium CA13]|uniref:Vault protein inter-alpha-trypsin n=1 Tax=Novipirellula herctigrandis TaxID=2527986 RepID=A0A5C5Z579_9BACT|nr:Vault protein inter-alpha-trypsin [Planctomycetes bacterium CA13]